MFEPSRLYCLCVCVSLSSAHIFWLRVNKCWLNGRPFSIENMVSTHLSCYFRMQILFLRLDRVPPLASWLPPSSGWRQTERNKIFCVLSCQLTCVQLWAKHGFAVHIRKRLSWICSWVRVTEREGEWFSDFSARVYRTQEIAGIQEASRCTDPKYLIGTYPSS